MPIHNLIKDAIIQNDIVRTTAKITVIAQRQVVNTVNVLQPSKTKSIKMQRALAEIYTFRKFMRGQRILININLKSLSISV